MTKGPSSAWEAGVIPENFGLEVKRLPEDNQREVFLSVEQVGQVAAH